MKIVFRADASRQLGSGHIMRCLALANSLRAAGAQCAFVSRGLPDSLQALLHANGHAQHALPVDHGAGPELDAIQTGQQITGVADWLVVDHYGLDRRWEEALRPGARRILVIDDLADRDHGCDLLLDQNFYRDMDTRYAGRLPGHCRTLLGPRYVVVREEFRVARAHARVRDGTVRRLLIFFGGMDTADCTSAALEALTRLRRPGLAVDVVIGAEHPARERITATCAERGHNLHVQTTRMAELMCAADLTVGAGGTASWERCCVGLPALLVAVADNQVRLVGDSELAGFGYAPAGERFDAEFFAKHLGVLLDDPARLRRMSERGLELVDGRGVQRVLRAMGIVPVTVRTAGRADSRNVFEWRNHPDIRRVSRSQIPIEWPAHEAWFGAVLDDANRPLLIGEVAGEPAGVVRFDIEGDSADVSIYKVPGRAERSSGGDLLAAAEVWLAQQRPQVRRLTATVLEGNEASHRLFLAAGYQGDGRQYSKRISE